MNQTQANAKLDKIEQSFGAFLETLEKSLELKDYEFVLKKIKDMKTFCNRNKKSLPHTH